MSFSPHEFERSHAPLSKSLASYESQLLDHEMKHFGGWVLRHKEYKSEREFFFDACARVTERLDRLDMLSDKEILHKVTEDGQDTWVAAVRSNGCGKLPKRKVRLIVNSPTDILQPDGSFVPGLDLQDIVIDPIRQKVGICERCLPVDPMIFSQSSNSETPPRIDTARFHNDGEMAVYVGPGYSPPSPIDASRRPLQELYEVNHQLLVLADLLDKLGVDTEQQPPIWQKHRDI